MTTTIKMITKFTLGASLSILISSYANSQSGGLIDDYPELANLYNAFDVTQAGIYDAIAAIGLDPASQDGRMELKMHLDMMAEMDHGGHGGHGGGMVMDMDGTLVNLKLTLESSSAKLFGAYILIVSHRRHSLIHRR